MKTVLALACLLISTPALADQSTGTNGGTHPDYSVQGGAQVVTTCGTQSWTAGKLQPTTQDLTGHFCTTDSAAVTALGNGVGTPGSSFPAQANGIEGRAATTDPTAVTDGQGVAVQATKTGRTVTAPYSIPELQVRGMATGTDNAAHSIIASAGGSLKNYITAVQCYNTSATTITVAFSDGATTSIIVPAGWGNNVSFPTPLVTAAATAFTFTASTGETTVGCSAQGYTGL